MNGRVLSLPAILSYLAMLPTAALAEGHQAPVIIHARAAQGQPTPGPIPPGVPQPGTATGPRDNEQKPETGTGRIAGRVIGGDAGTPLRRALVNLGGETLREGRGTTTDENGRFEFGDLPAGRFQLMASKAGYVSMAFGQRRPREPGKPIELRDGQRVDNIQLNLPRGGVITGRITDEFGEPVAGVAVQAQRHQYIEGRRQLVPVYSSGWTGTDDLGRYRAYGLLPGEYVLHAAQNNSGMNFGTQMETRSGFAPTYYPGTASESEAQPVRVTAGAEVTANFALLTARMVRVSGTALDSQGRRITNGGVMVQEGPPGRLRFFSMSDGTMIRPDGTFTLTLPPGEYVLHANAASSMSDADEKHETGWVPITVADADVSGVSIVTLAPATLRGQVIFDGAAAPPFRPAEVHFWAAPVNPTSMWFGGRPISARDDWTFEGTAQESPVMIQGGPRQQSGWQIATVMQRGVDVTDTGVVFRPGETVDDLQIVMSNRLSVVGGSVTTDRGAVAKEYSVVIFADDPNRWGPTSRFLRSARPDQQGQFEVKGLPAGAYLAMAVEFLEEGQERDPEFLQQMRPYATSVQLGDAERKVLTLRMVADR